MFHLNRTSVIWASLIARYKTAAKAATFDTIVGAQTLPLHQSYSANISASAASAPRRVVWGRPRYPLSLTPPLAPASGTPAEEESIKGLRTALMRIGLKWKKKKKVKHVPQALFPVKSQRYNVTSKILHLMIKHVPQVPFSVTHFLMKTQTLRGKNSGVIFGFPLALSIWLTGDSGWLRHQTKHDVIIALKLGSTLLKPMTELNYSLDQASIYLAVARYLDDV